MKERVNTPSSLYSEHETANMNSERSDLIKEENLELLASKRYENTEITVNDFNPARMVQSSVLSHEIKPN